MSNVANELDAPLGLTLTAALTEDAETLLFACLPRTLSVPNKHIFVFILHPDVWFEKSVFVQSDTIKKLKNASDFFLRPKAFCVECMVCPWCCLSISTQTTSKTINKIFLRLIRHNFVCRAARRRQPNTVFLAKCQKLHHRSLLQQQQVRWGKIIFEVQFEYFSPVLCCEHQI